MWLIFKAKMLSYHSETILDENIFFGKSTHLSNSKIMKMPVWGLYGKQGFHGLFWSMIYLSLKFKFNAIAIFRNRNCNFNTSVSVWPSG